MAVASGSQDVTANVFPGGTIGPVPALAPNLRWEDMNVSRGGIARGTTIGSSFVTVYNVSGSGLFFGFRMNLDDIDDSPSEDWFIRLIMDGFDVLEGPTGISVRDIVDDNIYDFDDDQDVPFELGIKTYDENLTFHTPAPVAYASSIEIQVRCPTSDQWRAGLVWRTIN